jgi:hypothetical protein
MRTNIGSILQCMGLADTVDGVVNESFRASDPPTSRLPIEPPLDAEAKYATARPAERPSSCAIIKGSLRTAQIR